MPFLPNLERLCLDRLHHYAVQLIDGTVRDGEAEGCWSAGTCQPVVGLASALSGRCEGCHPLEQVRRGESPRR
jgi:hypothetical protein